MHYLTHFDETSSARLRSIVDMHWGVIEHWVHLIAGSCYPFPEVMKALAEPMCVFPVEGLPGQRYYPGTAVMDAVERHAEELLCTLFAAGHNYRATIQPHSGTQANQIVFNAVLAPNDLVLSLQANDGGHISHKVLVGRRNVVKYYSLDSAGNIDYRALEATALRERPRLIIAGGSALPREIDFATIGAIAKRAGALLHADISHTATFVAAGVHAPVIPYADFVTFNMVKNMRGPNGGTLIYRTVHHDAVNQGLFPGTQGGPNENVMFAKLVALEIFSRSDIQAYARRMVGAARLISTTLGERGLHIVTGGIDSHLVLVDLRTQNVTGLQAEERCEEYRVLLNRNMVPGDLEKPWIASGIRIGTASITILNYSDEDIVRLANWIGDRITNVQSESPEMLINELTKKYNKALMPLERLNTNPQGD